eukprot:9082303-Lingulodinium_polyedra.AAC.1
MGQIQKHGWASCRARGAFRMASVVHGLAWQMAAVAGRPGRIGGHTQTGGFGRSGYCGAVAVW